MTIIDGKDVGGRPEPIEGRTHCQHGHELTEANVYRPPSRPNERECRICKHARRKRTGRPAHRPPHEPTEALRNLVQLAVSVGATQDQVARALGIAWATLAKHYVGELYRAKVAVDLAVAQTYRQKMLGGGDWRKADVPSLIWYTKARLGWTEAGAGNDNGICILPLGRDFRDI